MAIDMLSQLDIIIPTVSSIITGAIAYIVARRKQSSDTIKILLDANESFRNEIRADLALAKMELETAKTKIENLEALINSKDKLIVELQCQIVELTTKLTILELR